MNRPASFRKKSRPSPLPAQQSLRLSWKHVVELLAIDALWKRTFYENECLKANWSRHPPRRGPIEFSLASRLAHELARALARHDKALQSERLIFSWKGFLCLLSYRPAAGCAGGHFGEELNRNRKTPIMKQSYLLTCLLPFALGAAQAAETTSAETAAVHHNLDWEVVAELEQAPGNLAVSPEGRIFVSMHQHFSPDLRTSSHLHQGLWAAGAPI